jgi:hypothetical protein
MKELFFAKRFIILSLLSYCAFLSGAEKIAIQRSTDSDIQSIVIEKDFLLIKNKDKIYTFKLSELLKDKTVQTTRPTPKNLKEAFKYNGEWFFFNGLKNRRNRLCRFKKGGYKVFKKGDLLQRVLYKGKYYARDIEKNIYLPDWEIKKDFSPHFIPARQYLEALDNTIRALQINIKATELKIPLALAQFNAIQKRYNIFLTINNITIKKIDKNGNITIKESNGQYSKKIKKELKLMYLKLKKEEEDIESLISSFKSSGEKLQKLFKLKQRLEAFYKKYALNQKDVYLPVDICF